MPESRRSIRIPLPELLRADLFILAAEAPRSETASSSPTSALTSSSNEIYNNGLQSLLGLRLLSIMLQIHLWFDNERLQSLVVFFSNIYESFASLMNESLFFRTGFYVCRGSRKFFWVTVQHIAWLDFTKSFYCYVSACFLSNRVPVHCESS